MAEASKTQRRATTAEGFAVLWIAIKREPWVFALSTLGSALFGALTVADAWVLGWSTDHVVVPYFRDGSVDAGLYWAVLALFLGAALLRAVGIVARRLGAGIMQYRMQAHTRKEVTRRYLELPMAWHQKHPTGQLLSNANADVEAAWSPIAPLPMAVGTVVMMVIAVAQMLLTDTVLALVGLLVFPAVIVANVVYQRLASPLITRAQQLRAELSEVAHESFEGALVIKTLGREVEETARFAAKADALREANIRAGRIRAAFDPVLAALPNLGVLAVLVIGVIRVDSGATNAGSVVTIAYLLTIVSMPIRSIGWLLGDFPRSVVGWRRVSDVLEAEGRTDYGTATMPTGTGGIALDVDQIAFAFEPLPLAETDDDLTTTGALVVEPVMSEPGTVLDSVTFSVEPGSTTAIVGATGSGKSTLVNLLSRLIDPAAGRISVDGVDVRDLAHGELASVVAVVPQSAFLFDDTIRGNVTLGAEVSDDDLWQALEVAQAADFVAALPDGVETKLGERGTTLSGGQRQRLSLARALVRRPRLLILDDATSAVDPEVEQRILAQLDAYDSTVVVVAYRKATIGLADRVVYLADGKIADRGTHTELVARSSAYAELVNAYESENDASAEATGDKGATQ